MKTRAAAAAAPAPGPDPIPPPAPTPADTLPPTGYTGVRPAPRTPPAAHLLGTAPSRRSFHPTPSAFDPIFPARRPRESATRLLGRQRVLGGVLVGLGLALGLAGVEQGLGRPAPALPPLSPLVTVQVAAPTVTPLPLSTVLLPAALDALVAVYLPLGQQYVTAFGTDQAPDKFAVPCFPSALSARWQRVAIQQAAGIAQSWRTNRDRAFAAYQEELAEYAAHPDEHLPSTLPPGSTTSVRRASGETEVTYPDGWWLTLTVDEEVTPTAGADAPVVGVDVGIASFLTTSTGQHYGTFHGKLAMRHQRDRARRRRKAKLRACLKKKDVMKLPSPLPARERGETPPRKTLTPTPADRAP